MSDWEIFGELPFHLAVSGQMPEPNQGIACSCYFARLYLLSRWDCSDSSDRNSVFAAFLFSLTFQSSTSVTTTGTTMRVKNVEVISENRFWSKLDRILDLLMMRIPVKTCAGARSYGTASYIFRRALKPD